MSAEDLDCKQELAEEFPEARMDSD